MSFSATGILVSILHILCKIYFPILNDLESYISILVSQITYKLIIVSYGFAESKNLNTDLKIILLDYQNNYVGHLSWLLKDQHFFCSIAFYKIILMVQQSYFQI